MGGWVGVFFCFCFFGVGGGGELKNIFKFLPRGRYIIIIYIWFAQSVKDTSYDL